MQAIIDKFQDALRLALDAINDLKNEQLKLLSAQERLEADQTNLAPKLEELKQREAAVEKIERTEKFIKDTELLNVKNQEERAKLADERQKFELLKHEQETKHREQLILIAKGWKELKGE